MKNGLRAERLSACGFRANSWRLLMHTVAHAIVVLFREANAGVPEVATAQVSILRQRLWQVGAVVCVGVRRSTCHLPAARPGREWGGRVQAAVAAFASRLRQGAALGRPACGALPM